MNSFDLDRFFSSSLVPAGCGMASASDILNATQQRKFLRTGIPSFDAVMRLVPGELIFIGGRAASGKTALGMQIVHSAAKQIAARPGEDRGLVAVFSAEMTTSSLLLREACAQAGVPMQSLIVGSASDQDYDRVRTFLVNSKLSSCLYIDESPAPTLEHMAEQLSILAEAGNLELVMFDYLELAGEFAGSPQERVSKISRGLKALAKQFKVPVIALAQLNREVEKRADKKVQLSDFMFGGEQSADIAIGLLRPHLYDLAQPANLVEAHICKYRNGKVGVIELDFNEKLMRFSSAIRVSTPLNS
jgi:replicative DNA helicase